MVETTLVEDPEASGGLEKEPEWDGGLSPQSTLGAHYWFDVPLSSIWIMAGGIILIVGIFTAVRGFMTIKSSKRFL